MDKRLRARITAGGAGLVLLAGLGACAVRTGGSPGNYTYVLGDPRQNGPALLSIGSAQTAPSEVAPSETSAAAMAPAETSPSETTTEIVAPGVPDGTPPVSQGPPVPASVVNPPAGLIIGSATTRGAAIRESVPKSESTTIDSPPAVAVSMVGDAQTPADVTTDIVPDFASEVPVAAGELPAASPAVTAVTTASSTAVATVASIAPSSAAAPAATATVSKPTTLAAVATTTTSNNSGGGGGGSGDGSGNSSTTAPAVTAIPVATTVAETAAVAVPVATTVALTTAPVATVIPDATKTPATATPAVTTPVATTVPATGNAPAGGSTVSPPSDNTPPGNAALLPPPSSSIPSSIPGAGGDDGLADLGAEFDPAATPELGSLALFGSGAAGMGSYLWARLRRRR